MKLYFLTLFSFLFAIKTHGMEPVSVNKIGQTTALHNAARGGHNIMAKFYVNMGSDVNARDEQGRTPLYLAIESGHQGIVKQLLEMPAVDINIPNKDGVTPLHIATYKGEHGIVKRLLLMPALKKLIEDKDKVTPLHLAATYGHSEIVKTFLANGMKNHPDKWGFTPLHRAAEKGHETIVQQLLHLSNVNVNSFTIDGITPLHWAAFHGREKIVDILLSTLGININARDINDSTPLHMAIHNGHENVVKTLLLTYGIDVNACVKRGVTKQKVEVHQWTPLHIAVSSGHEGIVKLLLRTPGVDVNAASQEGLTPLDIALYAKSINVSLIRTLLLNGGQLKQKDQNREFLQKLCGKNLLMSSALLNNVVPLQEEIAALKKEMDNTKVIAEIKNALHFAIGQNNLEAAQSLMNSLDELHMTEVAQHMKLLLSQKLTAEQRLFYESMIHLLEQMNKKRQEEQCPFVLNPMMTSSEILPCNHKFHASCLAHWGEEKKICPVCNTDVKEISVDALDLTLMTAVMRRNPDALKTEHLLRRGANSNSEWNGLTPLLFAVIYSVAPILFAYF